MNYISAFYFIVSYVFMRRDVLRYINYRIKKSEIVINEFDLQYLMKKQMQKQTDNQNLKRQILLNNLVNQLLQNQMQSNTKHSDINLMELSDLFIWCEKKNPQLLRSIIEMDVIKKILQSQNDLELEIRSFVLLVNNCKLNGDIIIYLLANQIVDQVITKYIYSLKKDQKIDQQQKLEYLGSLLKAYNMHLNQKTFPYYKFKGKGQSLLVKICTRFYNCPQQLTRTSVMNILMNILKSDFSSELIYVDGKICYCIQQWCRNLCCQFRNQLKDINQKLFVVKDNQIQEIIQEINDKIVLWQDLSQTIPQLFQLYFKQQVILPLVVGSLNTLSLPMFNIKFSFFILAKLMKVMSNFGLMQDLGDVFLGQKNIKYKDSSVSTAVLKGFDLKYILNDQYYKVSQQNDDQAHSFLGTHEFFKNMLKSKDPHFLQIGCNFLQQIIAVALKNQSSCKKYYLNSLGISNNGFIIKTFTQILLNQFRYDHPLSLIVKLCQIISYIQKPGKYFSEDSLNIFVFVFRQLLVEALQMIQNNSQHWDYISQIYEYDLRTIKQISLQPKIKKDKDLLLSEDQNQNESAFYQKIPQIPCQYLRYKITKVILLKKFKMRITQCKQQNQIQKYIQRIDQWDSKTKKSGQFLYFPLKMKYFHCQILQDKLKVACLQLDDEVYFTLGFIEETHVKIMMNLKMKHISTEIIQKKDKHLLQLTVRKYSFAKQNLQVKSKILLRGLQNGSQYIAIKKMQLQQKQINNITKMIKRTLQQLPKISLI